MDIFLPLYLSHKEPVKTCYNLALFCKILNLYLRSFFLVFKTTQLSCSVGLDGWHDVQSLNLEQVKKKNPDSGFAASSCFDNICPWTPLWTLSTFLDRRFIWTLVTLFDALTLSSLPFLLASCWAWSQTAAADTFVFYVPLKGHCPHSDAARVVINRHEF